MEHLTFMLCKMEHFTAILGRIPLQSPPFKVTNRQEWSLKKCPDPYKLYRNPIGKALRSFSSFSSFLHSSPILDSPAVASSASALFGEAMMGLKTERNSGRVVEMSGCYKVIVQGTNKTQETGDV